MRAVEALLTGLIDYAGLFPPAGEDMRPALENYAGYLNGPDRWALGRFIVPVTRLTELEDAAGDLLPRGRSDEPWQLAVLAADDIPAAVKQIEEFNHPPFTVARNGDKVTKEKATDVLNYVVEDAKKDFTITRFKGLGEMNAEQLWDTTMNAETRTLLQVKLEDAVAAEDIFTTLMGENVEARRKFIEDNALEVVNLDI